MKRQHMQTIMCALTDRRRNRFVSAWRMFAASRAHSLAYGLTFRQWFPYALRNAMVRLASD